MLFSNAEHRGDFAFTLNRNIEACRKTHHLMMMRQHSRATAVHVHRIPRSGPNHLFRKCIQIHASSTSTNTRGTRERKREREN